MVKKLVCLLAVVVAGAAIWYFLFNKTDKDQVLDALSAVAEAASKTAGETTSSMLLKTQMVGGYFAEKCVLNIDDQMFTGEYTPEDISANMVRMRQFFTDNKLSFYDAEVLFPSVDEAVVNFTGSLKGTLKNQSRVNEAREIQAKLTKKSGSWRFYSFKIQEILKK